MGGGCILWYMARSLKEQIGKQNAFDSHAVEAMLNVYRTASVLSGPEHALLKGFGLSPASYNLLRILRGHQNRAHQQQGQADAYYGLRASEIGCQMVVRMPDVTRLVDRLEGMGLVSRHVCDLDKRVKYVKITKKGLALLGKIDPKVAGLVQQGMGHMSDKDLRELSRLLVLLRNEDESDVSTKSGGH